MLDVTNTLQLLKDAQNKDNSAKEKLITENSPLIKSIVRRYLNKGIEYDDLYQLGSLGFLKAINNYDETFNVKFSTYAVPMIAGEIKRYLRDNGIIKISRSIKTQNIQINRYIEECLTKTNVTPSISQIATHFNMSVSDVVFVMDSSKQLVSLNSFCGDDDDKNQLLIEKIPDDKPIEKELDNQLLYSIINKLPSRDKKIIMLRYFRDKTQKEIADQMGVSQVQISRLETRILKKIKESFNG